jgi:hypothetical protein
MKQIIFQHFMVVLIIASVLSCSKRRNNTPMMKNVTGKAGELVIVMQSDFWKGETGKVTKELLAQPQLVLPQDEPLFDLISIPHEAFGDIFKTTRALLIVKISPSEKNEIYFKDDVYAFLQNTVTILAKTPDAYIDIINQNSSKILGYYLQGERKRLAYNYSRYNEKSISNRTKEKFNLNISIPPGFQIAKETSDFMWLRYEPSEISQGILIYSFPYESDSTFTEKYLVAKRNIFTRNYVAGPTEGSYMATENEIPKLFNLTRKDGNYAAETRGLWRLENGFMGGPFVNLSILDLLNNRVLVIDGFVYAPGKDKRNYVRQLEAMIYSAEFINQKDIDKVNKQMEL